MRHAALLPLLLLAACDPFVAQVDEPRACTTTPAVAFASANGAANGSVPLNVSLDGKLAKENVDATVQLVSVTLTAREGLSDFRFVSAAQANLEPSSGAAITASNAVATQNAPKISGSTLEIAGGSANLYPTLAAGPARLNLVLEGSGPSSFTADVTTCVHVTVDGHVL